jgi:hypothetical protein
MFLSGPGNLDLVISGIPYMYGDRTEDVFLWNCENAVTISLKILFLNIHTFSLEKCGKFSLKFAFSYPCLL